MKKRWSEVDDVELLQLEAEMRNDLEQVREAATILADRAWTRSAAVARPAERHPWMRWVTASFAAAALAVGGVRLLHRTTMPANTGMARLAQVQPGSRLNEEALLQQVQDDLSGNVPSAMEPLQATEISSSAKVVQR